MENADEIWLVPGTYPDGKVSMRRRYLRSYESPEGTDKGFLLVAYYDRRVWTGLTFVPMRSQAVRRVRAGLLLAGEE